MMHSHSSGTCPQTKSFSQFPYRPKTRLGCYVLASLTHQTADSTHPVAHPRPSFHILPFNHISLFEIRLDNEPIIFYGSEDESTSQLLKGVVVLCLQSPLKIEDVHLQLICSLRYSWSDPSLLGHRESILSHKWLPFIGTHGKPTILPAGNYEWPFEYLLPKDTAESIEGIPEASIIYQLKTTIDRDKLSRDVHATRRFRVVRTLSLDSLEMMPSITIENTWRDKIDYSVSIPTKAAPFGSSIYLSMHFTPLLKGLELGNVVASLVETREFSVQIPNNPHFKEHRVEREVSQWRFTVTREDWHEIIEDTGQEGWSLTKELDLPKKLHQCSQDVNHHGIKIDHKIRVRIPLKNPDGHISELMVALPVHLFISPSMPLDGHGNLVDQLATRVSFETDISGPPEYGAHVRDPLYEDISGYQRNEAHDGQSHQVRMVHSDTTNSTGSSQRSSATDVTSHHSGLQSDLDTSEMEELNRVPTYRTALRSPLRSLSPMNTGLPDYRTAAGSSNERS